MQNSDNYIDVEASGTVNGTNVLQYKFNGSNNQQFILKYAGNGDYAIVPCHAPNMAISIFNSSSADGANIVISTYTGADNQKFRISKILATNKYKILSKVSNYLKYLNVVGASTISGANICQWTFEATTSEKNNDNSLWVFI